MDTYDQTSIQSNFHQIKFFYKKMHFKMSVKSPPFCSVVTVLKNHYGAASKKKYRQVSNIRRTNSQHLKDSRTALRFSLPNPLRPDVKSRMKM